MSVNMIKLSLPDLLELTSLFRCYVITEIRLAVYVGLATERSRVQIPAALLSSATLDKLFTHIVQRLWCYNVMLSVGVSRMGKTRSSLILERKLTAHSTAMSSSKRVCCLTSEQYVVITGGHCSRMERQRTPLRP